MTRLVLFDIDGTLLRTGGAGVRAFAEVFDRHFDARDGFENLRFPGGTDYSIVRKFFEAHRIPPSAANFEKFFSEYAVALQKHLESANVLLCPGVMNFIAQSRQRGIPVGLLTGNVKRGAEIKLRHAGLWEQFAFGGFADDHELRSGIAEAAKRRGEEYTGCKLAGPEVLVVGDTPLDVDCARSIGARVLAVATGGATLRELEQSRPDYLSEKLEPFDDAWLDGPKKNQSQPSQRKEPAADAL